ncbi:MAG TPA: hypothetical protein P5217_00855 [Methanoregulaceae archaeon]|nr:hypothetical protein [Methanoregulaceae archaeon]HPD75263.1 hypothetical protein [Methanoregulaceae archaeon]HRY74812.1 hypothetical protein [Methanoregulaceae archaeon]
MTPITAAGAAGDDRIAALERKIREQEALVKGITEELLDLKSIVMKLSKASEERSRQELKRVQAVGVVPPVAAAAPGVQAPAPAAGSTVVMRPKSARVETAKADEPAMDMIMQPDGTMKLEPRRGDKNYIVASAGYGRKKGAGGSKKQSDLIYAVDDEKSAKK